MQYGKGAEAGASFNNASQTFFGSKGSKNFLVKLTTFVTILFFINCFVMGLLNHKFQSKNIINILDQKEETFVIEEIKENSNFEDIPVENMKSENNK
jgi:preprotein translocase subunit SecG